MHRVCQPERPEMLIDHVLLGPSGIYVISYLPPELASTGAAGGQDRLRLHEAGASACAEHVDAIRDLLPPRYRDRARPVLCLRGVDERAEEVRGVLVTSPGTLGHIVRSSPPVLSTSEVGQAYAFLEAGLVRVPLAGGASRRRLRIALRVLAASVALAAASVGLVALGPDTIEWFRGLG